VRDRECPTADASSTPTTARKIVRELFKRDMCDSRSNICLVHFNSS
jgi:hypothetical protein